MAGFQLHFGLEVFNCPLSSNSDRVEYPSSIVAPIISGSAVARCNRLLISVVIFESEISKLKFNRQVISRRVEIHISNRVYRRVRLLLNEFIQSAFYLLTLGTTIRLQETARSGDCADPRRETRTKRIGPPVIETELETA